ncbi:hypothetical protein BVRB_3g065630 [Beta vulgaris subsp. vulgaris]|uniref:Uncharacterized protein n=1 Tax=Beta vulgaris subsp. vulgaris TaxID=3555 RepID=A0A0J8CS14_BETVV|nr:hypothetical protein BVRB_3g065630 [Beta vulgaris subsp. vulgaris]
MGLILYPSSDFDKIQLDKSPHKLGYAWCWPSSNSSRYRLWFNLT